jgi:hypothetical protein
MKRETLDQKHSIAPRPATDLDHEAVTATSAPSSSIRSTLLSAALLALASAVSLPAKAVPITYELDWIAPDLSGTFNGTPFANAVLLMTFEGDTSTVLPFTVQGSRGPVHGHINLVGSATFTIFNLDGTLSQSGSFLPSAGIFVAVDNTNGGIGFGSLGVPPSDPNFFATVQVAYPAGILVYGPSSVATYDLTSDIQLVSGVSAISWYGFPNPVAPGTPGKPLPITTLGGSTGYLVLNETGISQVEFLATAQAVTPFASLGAKAEVATDRFDLQGRFSLAPTSNGVNPLSEAVTLQLDSYTVTIPPGSFRRSRRGGYEFEGSINGVRLSFSFRPRSPSEYRFEIEGEGANVPQLTTPISMTLTIGDDSGTATVSAEPEE